MKPAITLPLYLSIVFLFATGCSKDDDASRTELISSSGWRYSRAGFDVNADGTIDADLPPAYLLDCSKDNILTFEDNGSGTVDEGSTKCDPADPQSTSFTWSFQQNESVINFPTAVFGALDGDVKIIKLTATELTISKLVSIGGGATTTVVVEFKH